MKILALIAQKGGSGKTTLACHLAVVAQEAGECVLLIDTDPQASAMAWAAAREAEGPATLGTTAAGLERALTTARARNVGWAIIDTAPHTAPDAAKVARASDLVLIPCRPSALDLAAASGTVRIVKAAGVRAAFVLSACPPRAPEIGESRDALASHGLPVAPVLIGDRRTFARALASGVAATEFEPEGRAATEIRTLWQWIAKEVA